MKSLHDEFLTEVETAGDGCDLIDLYLWPRTPIGNEIQEKIKQRVGVNDYALSSRHSRPSQIIRFLRRLLKHGSIQPTASILDVACGDAIVLWQLKKAFPLSECYGVDCNKGQFESHKLVQQEGTKLYRGFIQHLFSRSLRAPFDIVLMLNTYRGWDSADLRVVDKNLPSLADDWFLRHARYVVLTATASQVERLRTIGFSTLFLGPGEDDSLMICASKEPLPNSWWRWFSIKKS
ncbi:MAG TPA: class I SAM-dependent methyltransferase [Candidatus Obscuribacter sp.]|nr:class I SAM-dependent methyltransferase [Candidatus Obscuribacter sp.]